MIVCQNNHWSISVPTARQTAAKTIAVKGRAYGIPSVRVDGSLLSACGEVGSIHKLGSTLQGAAACNGWTFWHVEVEGKLQPIDKLRQTYLLATQV